MKKMVFLFICLLTLCSINIFAKEASGTYDLVEVIDGRLYYCNDGCLWTSDVNMNNIQLLDNYLPEYPLLFSENTKLYYKNLEEDICCYDVVTGKFEIYEMGIKYISELFVANNKIYVCDYDGIWEYDVDKKETAMIAETSKKDFGESRFYGIIDNYIYYGIVNENYDEVVICKKNLSDGSVTTKSFSFGFPFMHNDEIFIDDYFSEGYRFVVWDKNLKEKRIIKFNPGSLIDSRIATDYDVDDKYIYMSGICISVDNGEVMPFLENYPKGMWQMDTRYNADVAEGKIYMFELYGNPTYVIDTKENIAFRSESSMDEEKEYMKNTLLWRHLKNRYPDVDEECFVKAKWKNYSYYLDELNILDMLKYLDKYAIIEN